MIDTADLTVEFDETIGLVHLSARSPIRCVTREDGYTLAGAVRDILKKYFSENKGYMVTDYTRIILEPKYIDEYAEVIREFQDTYLMPGGLARYGLEISRVTAQVGHEVYLKNPANLFNTREEAMTYIRRLAKQNRDLGISTAVRPSTPEMTEKEPVVSPVGIETKS